ncbi:MAG: hypothetical protein P9M15_07785 [Candidatus Electryoneaceae bacterium]|nr:hypothetical protein [Candidatus Electryoneaceae bacterium]
MNRVNIIDKRSSEIEAEKNFLLGEIGELPDTPPGTPPGTSQGSTATRAPKATVDQSRQRPFKIRY